jgi:hypothetical protein
VVRSFFLLSLLLLIFFSAKAQTNDTITPKNDSTAAIDSSKLKADSTTKDSVNIHRADSSWLSFASQYAGPDFIKAYSGSSVFFAFNAEPITVRSNKIEFEGKEALFYTLIALLLFFAFLRTAFPKYLADLFRVTFRTTLKQRQIGEQLVQTPLPSLLLNIFFLMTGAFYIDFVLKHYKLAAEYNFWILYLYCFAALAAVYVVKFLSLKISGSLFNISETTNAYIFTVFLINKIIGVFLLPVIIFLAFSDQEFYKVVLSLSFIGLIALYGYRFILSYGLVRNKIKFNPFHFFVYLAAFEIVPLLLIYKLLLLWLK